MTRIIRGYLVFTEYLDKIVKWFCVVAVGAMSCVVVLQVFSRMLPIATPPWTEELARYLMIYMAFVGASSGIKRWNNIYVDFFINRMPSKVTRALEIIIDLCVLAFLIFLVYMSITVFPKVGMRQRSATMGFPMIYPQSAIIVGSIFMLLQMLGRVMRRFLKGGEENA